MKRNWRKIAEDMRDKGNPYYSLTYHPWKELTAMAMIDPAEATAAAFHYGYAMGVRASQTEQKRKSLPCANTTGKPKNQPRI